MNTLDELKGLCGATQMISTKMGLILKELKDNKITQDQACKEIDLLSREMGCISGTIKQVAWEICHPKQTVGV